MKLPFSPKNKPRVISSPAVTPERIHGSHIGSREISTVKARIKRVLFTMLAPLAASSALAACASDAGHYAPDSGSESTCQIDSDCMTGKICKDNICEAAGSGNSDGGNDAPDPPRIIVSPDELDFGAPLLGSEIILSTTIANIGKGTLEIPRVTVEENDDLDEFAAMPSGDVNWSLEPAGSIDIDVTLRFQDLQADNGNLVIESNDPKNPVMRVPLISELKGDPAVKACVLTPGWTDRFNDCEIPTAINLGDIDFGEIIDRDVTVWNNGTDNRPLEIEAVSSSNEALVDIEVMDEEGDPVVEYPVLLSASDGIAEPDFVTLRATISASISGAIEEALVVDSNDEKNPSYEIPVRSNVICPEDCSGAVCDLCCTPTGPESCDGTDNNCNGTTDEGELCVIPPPSECIDDTTVRIYPAAGACTDGECTFPSEEIPCTAPENAIANCSGDACDFECNAGFEQCDDECCIPCIPTGPEICDSEDNNCNGAADDGDLCTTLPPPVCVDDITSRVFTDVGECIDGDCEYPSEDITCVAPENGTSVCEAGNCVTACDADFDVCGDECCFHAWRPTSIEGAPSPRTNYTAIWTGSEMVIWGGMPADGARPPWLDTGGRYNPVTDAWRPTSLIDAPFGRFSSPHTAVWTGSEMLVWGGWDGRGPVTIGTNEGNRYDPVTDTWASLTTDGAPTPRGYHTAVFGNDEMMIWGGFDYNPADTTYPIFGDGGRFNPATNVWTPISTEAAPSARILHSSVWADDRMLVWGGFRNETAVDFLNDGGQYSPITNTWESMSTVDAPVGQETAQPTQAVWSGSEMIVWGGRPPPEGFTNTGSRYDPEADSWTPMSLVDVLTPRGLHTSVWTGSDMIIWGGATASGSTNTGAHYDPATDTWTLETPLEDVPSARSRHTAVWTGEEMIVWGPINTGGRYKPEE